MKTFTFKLISEDSNWVPSKVFKVQAESLDKAWGIVNPIAREYAYVSGKHFEYDIHWIEG
jgi:hypothetical protein